MHILQPKHSIVEPEKAKKLLEELNISSMQLPKIKKNDPFLPKESNVGDVIKIERKTLEAKIIFYRVVIP